MVLPLPEFPRQPDRAGDIDAGRAAEAKALVLQKIEDDRHRLLVGNEVGLVHFDAFDDRRHAAETDAFGDRAAFATP